MKKKIWVLFALICVTTMGIGQELKVMSYNIHIGQNALNQDRLAEIGLFIKESGVDLVGLQEVDSICKRSGDVDQMKVLAEITGMYYGYVRHFAFDGGSYGLGILSRFPIHTLSNERIPIASTSVPETRALLKAEIKWENKVVTFLNVHMDYRSTDSRIRQAEELIHEINRAAKPLILTGDLNASPGSEEIRLLKEVLVDSGNDTFFTFPAGNPNSKIDYILVDKKSLVRNFSNQVFSITYSDHLPILTTLQLQ